MPVRAGERYPHLFLRRRPKQHASPASIQVGAGNYFKSDRVQACRSKSQTRQGASLRQGVGAPGVRRKRKTRGILGAKLGHRFKAKIWGMPHLLKGQPPPQGSGCARSLTAGVRRHQDQGAGPRCTRREISATLAYHRRKLRRGSALFQRELMLSRPIRGALHDVVVGHLALDRCDWFALPLVIVQDHLCKGDGHLAPGVSIL